MGLSANRYYQLEARGLEGLVRALEPLPRGRRTGPEHEIAKLTAERDRLGREVVPSRQWLGPAGLPVGGRSSEVVPFCQYP